MSARGARARGEHVWPEHGITSGAVGARVPGGVPGARGVLGMGERHRGDERGIQALRVVLARG